MSGNMKTRIVILLALACLLAASCVKLREKISPTDIIIASTAVEDRVKMSQLFYLNHYNDKVWLVAQGEYSFLVGADSHVTTDPGRMDEMLAIGLRDEDLFYAHLGDIADTKAEYYVTLDSLLKEAKHRYVDTYFDKVNDFQYQSKENIEGYPVVMTYDEITFPFFPVVGNHDITRNGWALWSNIFHSSFYEIDVIDFVGDSVAFDHLIFLDSASGTLGKTQIDLIEKGVLDGKYDDGKSIYRHTFVFTHTNIFRPQFNEFASTFTREETFYLLDKFEEWNVTCVFCGHVHTWDERNFNGVHYLTLDTMSESGHPEPGDYLVRVSIDKDGIAQWSPVHMSYTPPKKKK